MVHKYMDFMWCILFIQKQVLVLNGDLYEAEKCSFPLGFHYKQVLVC